MYENITKRFFKKVSKTPACWLWIGYRTPLGYGHVKFNGKMILCHRLAYILKYGSIPKGKMILHRCDNPPCVRWAHLYPGTSQDNHNDMSKRGRSMRGEKSWCAKLSNKDAEWIRRNYNGKANHFIKRFKISYQILHQLIHNRTYVTP